MHSTNGVSTCAPFLLIILIEGKQKFVFQKHKSISTGGKKAIHSYLKKLRSMTVLLKKYYLIVWCEPKNVLIQ